MDLATFAPATDKREHPLADELRTVVRDHDARDPRSLQQALGPSEIGEVCAGRMARRLMDEPQVNTSADPWAAYVGTAVHARLADALQAANTRLGRIRYLVETRVTIRDGLSGSCDCYDADTATVLDHKILGESSMREYKRAGPPSNYRAQAHLYGVGLTRLGLPVRDVAIAMFPRGGMLAGLHVWSEPFDPAVAQAALDRHDAILEAACALDVDRYPGNYSHIPTEPGHRCTFCPYWKPGVEIGQSCPGHMPK